MANTLTFVPDIIESDNNC